MRWKQNHFYRVPIRTSRIHRCCNEVKGFFFCQSPVAAFPGEGWHEGKQSSWVMSLVFGASFLFDIIGEIPAWWHKSGNYGKKLLPTHLKNWTRDFVKLIVTTIVCPPHPTAHWLRKPCGRSTSVFCSVESRVAALDFGMSEIWFVIAVL